MNNYTCSYARVVAATEILIKFRPFYPHHPTQVRNIWELATNTFLNNSVS
jgi:hypothetical protein